jgi:LmbE family N-acetylglucosaminyl deacetylase
MPQDTSLQLMAILAHPDDESIGIGATLARYAAEGVDVTLITATRGQYGWPGAPAVNPGPEALGRQREAELRAAARALGLRELVLLDYVDGELDQADGDQVVCELVAHLRRVRPQVVVTFGLDGVYGHPDHMAISRLTTAALVRAADPRYGHRCTTRAAHAVDRLYHMAMTAERAAAFHETFGNLSMLVDGVERQLVITPPWQAATRIDAGEHWRVAWQAVACHRSQLPNYDLLTRLTPGQQHALWGINEYQCVYSTVPVTATTEDDLFAGLHPPATDRLALAA